MVTLFITPVTKSHEPLSRAVRGSIKELFKGTPGGSLEGALKGSYLEVHGT